MRLSNEKKKPPMNAMLKRVFGKADKGGLSQSISDAGCSHPPIAQDLPSLRAGLSNTLSGELTLTSR